MKKIKPVLFVLIAAIFVFAACGKKDVSVYDIEGTWETVSEGKTVTLTSVYTFKTDMTYTRASVSSTDVVSLDSEYEGTFTLSGNKIVIKGGMEDIAYKVSFRKGDMIFTAENGAERVLKRKS